MKVLVFDGPGEFHIESRDRPKPGPEEVRIRIAYTGICGSDLHGFTGESGRRVAGMVMGHEASGWVDAVGDSVVGLSEGTPVTFNPAICCDGSCGHQVENQCSELRVIGVTPDIQGAFADEIVVPADRVIPIDGLDMKVGAIIEPLAVGIHAVRRCGVVEGDEVLVVGGGMIGQCVARAARSAGASRVVVTDLMEERRSLAVESGLEAVEPDGVAHLGYFDRAFDAVGISATASTAIKATRKGATVCFVGLGKPEILIPLFDIVADERIVVGSFAYTDGAFREATSQLIEHHTRLDELIGWSVPMEEIPEAFSALAEGRRRDVKVMMEVS